MRAYRATPEGKAATRKMERERKVTPERKAMMSEQAKAWAATPRGKASLVAADRKWKAAHKDKVLADERKRRAADPKFKMAANLRRRIRDVAKARGFRKGSAASQMLGCTYGELRLYIEAQFAPGMTWENFGEWHIDHCNPITSATTLEEMVQLSHYTNLQPMWAKYNRMKQDMTQDEWRKYTAKNRLNVNERPLN
jgi:hypothetical protein